MTTRSLLRVACIVVASTCLLAFGGCLKASSEVTIKADGSGTARMVMTIDMSKMEELSQMMQGMGGGPEGDPLDEMDPTKKSEALGRRKGIKVVSSKKTVDAEKKETRFEIVVAFDSLEAYYRSGLEEDFEVSLVDNGDGTWTFTRRMVNEQTQQMESEEARAQAEMMMGMFEPMVGGLEVSSSMTFPGAVMGSNGDVSVRWAMGFKDMIDPAKWVQTVTFNGKGLKLEPFDLKWTDVQRELAAADAQAEAAEEGDGEEKPEPVKPGDGDK